MEEQNMNEDQNKQEKQPSSGFNPAGLMIGMGIGLCFGVSMGNLALSLLMGLGVGLCYSVALGHKGEKK